MKHEYISVIDGTGRTSTLDLGNPAEITVIGVLPHYSDITPKTVQDADKLIAWLTLWASNKELEQ